MESLIESVRKLAWILFYFCMMLIAVPVFALLYPTNPPVYRKLIIGAFSKLKQYLCSGLIHKTVSDMIEKINRSIDKLQETYYKFIWYRDWLLFGFATFKNVLSEWISYKEVMLKHGKEATMKALINVRLNKGDSIPKAEFAANVIFEMMESAECFSFWFILFKSRLLERAWIQNKEKETKNETLF